MVALNISLRDVIESDLPVFFEFQLDPESNRMAAFTAANPSDRAAFDLHWKKILEDESLVKKTILVDGQVVGSLGKFIMFEKPQVTYWIGREFWGRGIATQALSQFLAEYTLRPLYAQAASDNAGSIRVLEKCGFRKIAADRGYANARGEEIDEVILELKPSADWLQEHASS